MLYNLPSVITHDDLKKIADGRDTFDKLQQRLVNSLNARFAILRTTTLDKAVQNINNLPLNNDVEDDAA